MPASLAVICFLIGCALGSFLNVVIYRVPLERSVVSPGSACPHCGTAIRPWHNIPVLGWLMLGGRCATCKEGISARYPVIEASMGLIVVALAWFWGPTVDLLAWSVFAALLMVIFWIDIDHQLILDVTNWPGVALGLLYHLYLGDVGSAALAAALGYGGMRAISELARRFYKDGLGLGDVKFAALLGAWLGWPLVGVALFLSFLVGSIVGLGMLVRQGSSRPYPFGPSMIVGALIALGWGGQLWSWYIGWMV